MNGDLYDNFSEPVTFTGKNQLQVGDTAHDFSFLDSNWSFKETLAWLCWQKKVLSIIPSIDCVCSTQTSSFQIQEPSTWIIPSCYHGFQLICLFAQGKWCAAEGIENAIMLWLLLTTLSAVTMLSSSMAPTRAVLVLDENKHCDYAEYVDNIKHRAWSLGK